MILEFLLQVVDGPLRTLLFTMFMGDKEICDEDLFQFESVTVNHSITIAKNSIYSIYLF